MSGCGAIGSALALGARGCQFESGHPDHFYKKSLLQGITTMKYFLFIFFLSIPLIINCAEQAYIIDSPEDYTCNDQIHKEITQDTLAILWYLSLRDAVYKHEHILSEDILKNMLNMHNDHILEFDLDVLSYYTHKMRTLSNNSFQTLTKKTRSSTQYYDL